jgi:predicted nucleotidyltransferase
MAFIKTLKRLESEKLIHPPRWLIDNTGYITQMGSVAYGVSNADSDQDIYGFCIPTKELLFPHLSGEIPGFGRQVRRFEQYQEHGVTDHSSGKEYDITIYSIVKYFHLCMENNPNMIDSLFTPRRCVLHSTAAAELMIENRKSFLHKGAMHKLRGYAYAQLSKIENQANSSNEKRKADIAVHGFDTKASYHLVRLILQAEQILTEHDLDLERNREILKSIRRGEWELARLKDFFTIKEKSLEEVYARSTLRDVPDEAAIKSLLLTCLENHYGSLDKLVATPHETSALLNDLQNLIDKYRI